MSGRANRTSIVQSRQHTVAADTSDMDAINEITEASSDHEYEGPRAETSITRWPFFPLAVGALVISLGTSIAIMALASRIITIPTHLYLSEHKHLY